jgi:hypothetical protein
MSNKTNDSSKNTKQTIQIKTRNKKHSRSCVCVCVCVCVNVCSSCLADVHDFLRDQVRRIERLGLGELDAQRGETRHDLRRERESGEQNTGWRQARGGDRKEPREEVKSERK